VKNIVNQRLKMFIEYLGINNVQFGNSIGETKQSVGNWLNDIKIPVTCLSEIVRVYPTLNARWLLTGEGQMIEGEKMNGYAENGSLRLVEEAFALPYKQQLEMMQKMLDMQEKYVKAVERENEELRIKQNQD